MDPRLAPVPNEPDYDELLPPRIQGELRHIELGYLRDYPDLARDVIAARADAAVPVAAWQHAVYSHQEALVQQAVFGSRAGAQAAGPSLRGQQALWALLVLGAAVETAFAFNGVRYGLGQYGQIEWPWEDPLSLLGAVAIAAISLAVAQSAGVSLAWAEARGLLADPAPVDLSSSADFVAPFDADPLAGGVLAAAPVEDVLHAGSPALVATAGATGDVGSGRRAQVFRRTRPRAAYRRAGWLLVALGITLWTVNGLMRAQYLDRLPAPSAAQFGGLLTPSATSGAGASDPDGTAVLIIALSVMVFVGSVLIVQRMHPAAYLRARELDRRVEITQDAATLAAADAAEPLRRVAEAQARLEGHTAAARVAAASARLPHAGW
jgi:hypothetical protein